MVMEAGQREPSHRRGMILLFLGVFGLLGGVGARATYPMWQNSRAEPLVVCIEGDGGLGSLGVAELMGGTLREVHRIFNKTVLYLPECSSARVRITLAREGDEIDYGLHHINSKNNYAGYITGRNEIFIFPLEQNREHGPMLRLYRVDSMALAHEIGHSIGYHHIDNESSVMTETGGCGISTLDDCREEPPLTAGDWMTLLLGSK